MVTYDQYLKVTQVNSKVCLHVCMCTVVWTSCSPSALGMQPPDAVNINSNSLNMVLSTTTTATTTTNNNNRINTMTSNSDLSCNYSERVQNLFSLAALFIAAGFFRTEQPGR